VKESRKRDNDSDECSKVAQPQSYRIECSLGARQVRKCHSNGSECDSDRDYSKSGDNNKGTRGRQRATDATIVTVAVT